MADAIGITDLDWFRQLRKQEPTPERVNFWTPTPWSINRVEPGDRWYLMLKSPVRKIGGFGVFESYEVMSVSAAWQRFGPGNGVESFDELKKRTRSYAERRSTQEIGDDHEIGCVILRDAQFWDGKRFRDPLTYLGTPVPNQVVTFKYVQTESEAQPPGLDLSVGALDATFSVEQEGDSTYIQFESRGPDRNVDYLEGLEVLLETLGSLDASLLDVLIDSRGTARLADEERRVDPGQPYPIRLSRIQSFGDFRRDLTRSVAQTAREDDSAGGGNPTKRLRLEVEVPGRPSVEDLSDSLSLGQGNPAMPPIFSFNASTPNQGTEPTTRKGTETTSVGRTHARMQESLYEALVDKQGADAVAVEQLTASGRPADIVVKGPDGYVVYEIKTARTAKDCVRQALGQLLEYAYWPGSPDISELWVVGPGDKDDEAEEFLADLRSRFGLPIWYREHRD